MVKKISFIVAMLLGIGSANARYFFPHDLTIFEENEYKFALDDNIRLVLPDEEINVDSPVLIGIPLDSKDIVIPDNVSYNGKSYTVKHVCLAKLPPDIDSFRLSSSIEYFYLEDIRDCNIEKLYCADITDWLNINFVYDMYSGAVGNPDPFSQSNPLQITKQMYVGNSPLTNLIIPEGTKDLKTAAFANAAFLESVDIPASLNSVGYNVFENCRGLKNVNIHNLSKWITFDFCIRDSSKESVFYNTSPIFQAGQFTLDGTMIDKLEIPEGSKSISLGVFENCLQLKEIYFPEGFESISLCAFVKCPNISKITLSCPPPKLLEDQKVGVKIGHTFDSDIYEKAVVSVPLEYLEAYRQDESWSRFRHIIASETGSVNDLSVPDYVITINGKKVAFSDNGTSEVSIHSLNGTLFYRGTERDITIPAGVCIVTYGKESVKIYL